MFVIGLSTEEPAFKRTTTWKALVAAKAWVSHYPKLVDLEGQFPIQAFKADSQRMAFSVCLEFSVYGTMV